MGYPDWLGLNQTYDGTVFETVVAGQNLYFAGTNAVLALKVGTTSFATVADSPQAPSHIAVDGRGDLLAYCVRTGATKGTIYALAAGGASWMPTSPLILSTGNGGEATNLVFDSEDRSVHRRLRRHDPDALGLVVQAAGRIAEPGPSCSTSRACWRTSAAE